LSLYTVQLQLKAKLVHILIVVYVLSDFTFF